MNGLAPIDNTALLRDLIARGRIALRAAPILNAPVQPVENPHLRDRVEGMLLGLATGDALGTTLEFKRPGSFEPIRDMTGGGPFRLERSAWPRA